MVESMKERDILNVARNIYAGHDTGQLKKIRISAKKSEQTKSVSYANRIKRVKTEDGEVKEISIPKKGGALTEADDQTRVSYDTGVQFKLGGRFLEQVRDEGIQCMGWTQQDSKEHISMVRGKTNKVQVFNTQSESIIHTKTLAKTFEAQIKGLHCLSKGTSNSEKDDSPLYKLKQVIVDQQGNCAIDILTSKKQPTDIFKLRGDNVVKTYMHEGML